ncbi:MAG TPA: zf-HC2 domain-containing protein [Candidatus Acidoferrum sp.]|jgi:anti-sigma factor RsiW
MIWTCEQIETRLSDYLDDAMSRNDRVSFDAHVAGCERCAPLVAHLSKLLTSMHVMEQIEPPPRLIYAILDKTLGKRETVSGWRAIFGWFEGITTMRLAYGALSVAGTVAILLSAVGFNFAKPKLADLRPTSIYRKADSQAHLMYAKGTKFVNDLRVVNEIQSRLRQDSDMPTSQEGVVPSREKQPGQTDGTKPATPRQQNRADDLTHNIEILADELPIWAGRLSVPTFLNSMVARRLP